MLETVVVTVFFTVLALIAVPCLIALVWAFGTKRGRLENKRQTLKREKLMLSSWEHERRVEQEIDRIDREIEQLKQEKEEKKVNRLIGKKEK